MDLIQERDLCFFDLESTGLNTEQDGIIEIAIIRRIETGPGHIQKKFHSFIQPLMPISKGASDIHGIKNDDERLLKAPTFREIADSIYAFFEGADIGGFNIFQFDLPLLTNEFGRVSKNFPEWDCEFIDVANIYKRKEERTLSAAVEFYLGRPHTGAHGALSDTEATQDVLSAQLEKYDDLPRDIKKLALYSNYDSPILDFAGKFKIIDGKICYNFGKQRGRPVEEDTGLAEWMLTKDFPMNSKKVAREILRDIQESR